LKEFGEVNPFKGMALSYAVPLVLDISLEAANVPFVRTQRAQSYNDHLEAQRANGLCICHEWFYNSNRRRCLDERKRQARL